MRPVRDANELTVEAGMKRILKVVLGAIGALIALCIVGSIIGSRDRAAREAAAQAAAEEQVANDRANKAKLDKAVAALRPELSGDQLVGACMAAAKAGGIPDDQAARCGDAVLAAAQAALTAKRPADAIPLFEVAAKVASKQSDAQAGLSDAKLMVATETATADFKRAEAAWAAKEYAKALGASNAAQRSVDEGLKEKPDDATLKALLAKLEPLRQRAQEWKLAGEVVKLAGELPYEYSNGALVVQVENHTEGEFKDILVSGHISLRLMASEGFAKMPSLQSITVIESHTFTDARGNSADPKKVAELKVTRKNAATIGWDSISPQNLYKALDKKWVDPRVHIEDAL
jgi:hypothetical protein